MIMRPVPIADTRRCSSDCVDMANWHSSGDWQFKQPVAMALPTVILKAGDSRGVGPPVISPGVSPDSP